MLFKPDTVETAEPIGEDVTARGRGWAVWSVISLAVLGGLGYLAWTTQEK
jgi:nitrate reductase NapE component